MTPIVVTDKDPMIGLGRISRFSVIKRRYKSITIPPRVLEELCITSDRPGARALSEAIADGWISIVSPKKTHASGMLSLILDAGKAEAIQLASERNAQLLVIDDRRGREIALSRGIKINGTGGILIAAKKAGILGKVKPVLDELSSAGYRLSEDLCNRIIDLAGEK